MYKTELVKPDVQLKVLNGAKACFCAIVSVFIATHGMSRGGFILQWLALTSILYIRVINSR